MTREAFLEEFRKLPLETRIELAEQLWDEIEPEQLPIPEWHKEELDRCLDDPSNIANIPWKEVLKRLRLPRG